MPSGCGIPATLARSDLAPGLRMTLHGRYIVLYRDLPGETTVRVERVLHSARNLPRLLYPPIWLLMSATVSSQMAVTIFLPALPILAHNSPIAARCGLA